MKGWGEDMSKVEVVYNTEFFRRQSTGSRRSALVVLKIVFSWLAPRRIVDVGCGVGTWLAAAQELGAGAVLGIDGAHVDRSALQLPAESFAEVDLENEAIGKAVTVGAKFDLVICMEVAEHLSFPRAPSFIRELASLGDAVLFSAAVPYQAGTNHINEQWPEFWAILFEAENYICLDAIRDRIWYNGDVEWWYRQNALLFVRRGSESYNRIVTATAGEVARPALSRVHAENLLFQVLNTFRTHRAAAREEEVEDLRAVLSAYAEGATVLPRSAAVARADLRPEADDVFPRTRMIVSEPERDEAWLRDRVQAAEAAHAAAADVLADTQALVQVRGTELVVTRDLLYERQSQLDHTRQLLYERQASVDAALAERDEAIRQLESVSVALIERGAILDDVNRQLEERSYEFAAARQALADRTRHADDLAEVLRRQEAVVETLHARTEQGGRDLDAAYGEVTALRHDLRRIPRLVRRLFGTNWVA